MAYMTGHGDTNPSVAMTTTSMELTSTLRPRGMGVILSVASGLIMSTNLLVAAALLKLLRRRGSQSWCFVLNLALADILVGVAITGLATDDLRSNNPGNSSHIPGDPLTTISTPPPPLFDQGKARCLMRMAFVTSPCTASIMSMFLISLDRYAAIKMPLRYSQLSGKGTVAGCLVALWISSLIIGFLPVMVRQLQTEDYRGFCAFFSVVYDVGIVVLFCVCFFPVLCVFVFIYLDILKIACSHQRQICQVRQAGSRTLDHSHHPPPPHLHHHQQQQQQQRSRYWGHVKALRTVAVLVGCFLVLWCPFFVVCMVKVLCADSCRLTTVLENYLWLLGLSNSLINPLVYAFWQREVRLELAAMFPCFKVRLLVSEPSGAAERCHPQQRAPSPAGVTRGDAQDPTLLPHVTCHDEAHTVPLSASTGL